MNPYHFGHYNHNHGGYPYNHHHVHPHDHWFHDPLWPVMIYPGHDHPPYIDCMDHHVALFSTVGRGLTGEKGEKGDQGDQGIQGPEGPQGQDGPAGYGFHSHWEGTKLIIENEDGTEQDPVDLKGAAGDPGISVTHEWDGTTLIINSASGTSSADLKGDPGYFDNLTESQLDDMVDYIGQRITQSIICDVQLTFRSIYKNNSYKWKLTDIFELNPSSVAWPAQTEYPNTHFLLYDYQYHTGILAPWIEPYVHSGSAMNIYINGLLVSGSSDPYHEDQINKGEWHLTTSGAKTYVDFEYPIQSVGETMVINYKYMKWPAQP